MTFLWDDVNDTLALLPQTAADAELSELLETLRSRDDMRMLFKLAKDATPDDVRKAVKIIEALYND